MTDSTVTRGYASVNGLEMYYEVRGVGDPLFRLLPHAQLAVLPGTDHVELIAERTDWLLPMIDAFLDAPMPERK